MSALGVLRSDLISAPAVWIEITKSEHGHGGPDWEFGTCLWSPTRNRKGHDSYAIMRQPRAGDRVLHFFKDTWPDGSTETRLSAHSKVRTPVREVAEEPPSPGDWKGMAPYYRIDLADHAPIRPALPVRTLCRTYADEIRQELAEDEPRHFPFNIYQDEIRTVQAAYLTRATPRLVSLILPALGLEDPVTDGAATTSHETFAEGQRRVREAYFFARNPGLVKEAKWRHGYRCMACGFDFEAAYGEHGRGFIECHHLNPLSERAEAEWPNGMETRIDEVAVLCANCHRMVHRRRPALTLAALSTLIRHSG